MRKKKEKKEKKEKEKKDGKEVVNWRWRIIFSATIVEKIPICWMRSCFVMSFELRKWEKKKKKER
jgi:hypothetical protein